jgi:hypothetical protein
LAKYLFENLADKTPATRLLSELAKDPTQIKLTDGKRIVKFWLGRNDSGAKGVEQKMLNFGR